MQVRGVNTFLLLLVGSAVAQARGPSCGLQLVNQTCYEGNTVKALNLSDVSDCCAECMATQGCTHFTLNLDDAPGFCRLKSGAVGSNKESSRCTSGTSSPAPSPPSPTPPSPAPPAPSPPDPQAPRPNIIMIMADDLGWYDTSIYNSVSPTPRLANLTSEGIRLDRHYVFRYCSPTRRAFLSGRFPNQITTVQPDGSNMCSDFLPLAVDILPQKLSTAGYVSHFIGKGHLGYQTMDHLPVNRGFKTHVGYLGGSEGYSYGSGSPDPTKGTHDMWHDLAPGTDVVPKIFYSANFYAERATEIIESHDVKDPFFMYYAIQNVHSPYQLPPSWETKDFPEMWDHTYANMLAMLDMAVGNVTDALKRSGLWQNTLIVFTADNGGVGKFGNNHPLRGHKHDPWEGGTRATAFVSGGFVPSQLRGTSSGDKLVHVTDWYPTFCALAGVDARNDAYIGGAWRHIDGVDVWPLLTGSNATQPRTVTPTTEASIIETHGSKQWWKLVTLAGQSNYYNPNATQYAGSDPCLQHRQPDPPQPGRTDALVTGCPVCNATQPCLYDILADPLEQHNVAKDHADVVARLAPILDVYNDHYVTGRIDKGLLAANYTKLDKKVWGGYTGPCYKRKDADKPDLTPGLAETMDFV